MEEIIKISLVALFITVCIILMCIFVLNKTQKPDKYVLEDYIVPPNWTFWSYYCENLDKYSNYDEALYTFKQDNNMKTYQVYEGQTVKLRKWEK